MTRRTRWIVIVLVAALTLGVGAPWVYINLIRDDAPAELTLSSTTTTGAATDDSAPGDVNGTWRLTADSVVGYRVKEILFGQDAEGVGRTSEIDGSLTIVNNTVSDASFTVDMTSLVSDDTRRDNQFRGALMDTANHPTATFELDSPIALTADVLDGADLVVRATGTLTLRGVTRAVEFELQSRLTGTTIEVVGGISIVFAEWEIPNPSRPGVSTEDNGELEFRLIFERG